ncbi:hypothetical protein HYV81_06470 [Candidatus Woesearchaeota archaeon]|nr:hypothetical protein [Candidatus Woesearchaeota archaeon]
MDITKAQERIMKFVEQRMRAKKFNPTPELSYIHLTEEMGEIARQLSNKQMRSELYDEENLKEEIVDVLLETLILAKLCNVDLDKEIPKKIDALFKKHGFKE